MKIKKKITQKILKRIVTYDPSTGVFTANAIRGPWKIGSIIGSYDKDGYLQCKIAQRVYKLHRLAFLYMTGEWPEGWVDHRNRKRDCNRSRWMVRVGSVFVGRFVNRKRAVKAHRKAHREIYGEYSNC